MADAVGADATAEDLILDGLVRPRPGLRGQYEALLPSTSVQCHAANLMPLGNGDLGCVWFGGTQEGMADISIHFSRLKPGSDCWTQARRLEDDPTRSEQNPILFPMPDGPLMLLYTSQRSGNQDTAIVRHRSSTDHGATWSPPSTLIDTPGTFVRQPLHIGPDGEWLLPVFACRTRPGERWTGNFDTSAVMISRDQGRNWEQHPVPASEGCVHMNILGLRDGTLLALYRSRWADHIYASRSSDGGRTWSPPAATALPNNNASIQATVLADGRIALVYNASSAANAPERRQSLYDEIPDDIPPVTPTAAPHALAAPARTAFWGAPRAPLCLTLSGDKGLSWSPPQVLDVSDGYCMTNNSRDGLNRELSYPSIRQTPDGTVHIAYTYFRRAIKYLALDVV
ncbi:MAG: exo-alpha-sialidase [Hyphomicrobiaceae bacterium]